MKAMKYCNCQDDATSDKDLLKGWLVGAVRRGHINLQVTTSSPEPSIIIKVTTYQGMYKCDKCGGVDHITVLEINHESGK